MSAIDDELKQREKESEAGKTADIRKSELAAIIAKRNQTKAAYGAKAEALTERWKELVTQFSILRKGVASVYDDLPDQFKKVCKVIDDISTQRKDKVDKRRGENEVARVCAAETVTASKAKLDAWMALDLSLVARLKEADTGLKEVEALFGGPDLIFSIYLLWFKVRPTLIDMAPEGQAKIDDGPDPGCRPPPVNPKVYLIDPDKYAAAVDAALSDYDKARADKQAADNKFKQYSDDLAAELTKLKDMTDGVDLTAKKALEP